MGLMLVVFFPVIGSFKKQKVGRFTRVMRGFCLWVRDEMVYSVMGKEEGRAFVPLFFFMFFFFSHWFVVENSDLEYTSRKSVDVPSNGNFFDR